MVGPLRNLYLSTNISERFFCWKRILASQSRVCESLPGDLREQHFKALAIVYRLIFAAPIVEAEHLFIAIAVKVEGLNGNIRTAQRAL